MAATVIPSAASERETNVLQLGVAGSSDGRPCLNQIVIFLTVKPLRVTL